MAEVTQVIVSSENGLAQEIVFGDHRWRADEPAPFGTDTGPSPYELLLASLGACTSMTLRLYAQRKGMDLKRITVRLQHYRIHAEDCRECETKAGWTASIVKSSSAATWMNLKDVGCSKLRSVARFIGH